MASISIENGKRIEELLEISRVSSDSFFLVSETDLTRKITLQNLRNAFNGDSATDNLNNLYYSVEKINELLGHIRDDIDKINSRLDNLEDRITNIYDDIGADLSEFKKYVEQIYAELKLADQTLQNNINSAKTELTQLINQTKTELEQDITDLDEKIDNVNSTLGDRITTLNNRVSQINTDLTNKINNVNTTLGNRITEVENDIDSLGDRITAVENKLTGITSIRYGSSVPSTLATGAIYLQYF